MSKIYYVWAIVAMILSMVIMVLGVAITPLLMPYGAIVLLPIFLVIGSVALFVLYGVTLFS